MTVETLKGIKQIDGFNVVNLDEAKTDSQFFDKNGNFNWENFDMYRKDFPVSICDSENMVSFKLQKGPIKEHGLNGCQVDTIVAAALIIITKLNEKFPCVQNVQAIHCLTDALSALDDRRRNRELRGVEGTNQL